MNTIRIAIDGPSGAGKSTLARAIAGKLGYLYVDTGAIYRTVGYYARGRGLDLKDGEAVAAALPEVTVGMAYGEDGLQHMLLNGEDVTEAIRLPEISLCASAVSAHPGVRAFLLEMQRKLAREHSVIMDGRDIGTCVLPEAQVKVYLTASVETRGKRRFLELQEKGQECELEKICQDIRQRDMQDMNREISPLRQAEDAVLIDSSDMTIEEVVAEILALVRK